MSYFKATLLALLAFIISCASTTDPLTGKKVYTLLPTEEEIKLGREYIPQSIAQGEGLYPDGELQSYISRLGHKIAANTPRKLPYRFYLLNSSAYNAFAIPGGGVFITRGLLSLMENESELVGVLAHELGHLNARHHARYLEKVLGISLLLQVAALLVSDDDNLTGQLILQAAAVGAGLLTLKFSRDQERESDRLAVRFAVASGYDPKGLLSVFRKLKKAYREAPPEWLSTHPLPSSRIKEVSELISSMKLPQGLVRNTAAFERVKGRLKSKERAFSFYEEGKKLLKEGRREEALRKFRAAIAEYREFQMPYVFCAVILSDLGRLGEALSYADKAAELDPELFWTRFTKGVVLFKLSRFQESLRELEYAKRLVKGYADTYYYLGRDYEALGNYPKAKENFGLAIQLASGKEEWLQDAKRRYRAYGGR